MHALVLEEIGKLVVVERPNPSPGPGEVLLAVTAVGICGSDLHGFSGENGRRHPGQVMGHEASGVIAAVGEGVDGLPLGAPATFNPMLSCGHCTACLAGEEQRCAERQVIGVVPQIDAAFADFVRVPAGNVHLLPEGLAGELGALIEPIAVAIHALRRCGAGPDDRLLVVGGGPIGQSVVVAALAAGISQIAVSEPDEHRRALCATLGVPTIDPTAEQVADAVVAHLGAPATVAVDAVGVPVSVASALAGTTIGATVVLLGMGSPALSLAAFEVSVAERNLVGSFAYSRADFTAAVAHAGRLGERLRPLVSGVVPAANGHETFERLLASPPPGKVLLGFPL